MNTILVVDDEPISRYATVRLLEHAGYDVREAATGREALRLARLPVDLIVLDLRLPDVDGFAVCRQLKSDLSTAWIPVVHKSGVFLEPQDRTTGFASGADEYLTEPVDPATLLRTVEDLLQHAEPSR